MIIWQKVGGIILIFLPDIISTIKRSLLGEEWTERELVSQKYSEEIVNSE